MSAMVPDVLEPDLCDLSAYSVLWIHRNLGAPADWDVVRSPWCDEPVIMVDLRRYWDVLTAAANARHMQKDGYDSTDYMNEEPHHLELYGEAVYACVTGLSVDLVVRPNGDQGFDFAGRVDVKTVSAWNDPILKHQLEAKKRLTADWYVAVGFDLERRRGWVAGHASVAEFRLRHKVRRFREDRSDKNGNMMALHCSYLANGVAPPHADVYACLLQRLLCG